MLEHRMMKTRKWQARTRLELIIEVWEALDCESVGERELLAIQDVLRESLGAGAVVSPAAIARELADEGATLRHPEVLNCDSLWREQQLVDLFQPGALDFTSLAAAASSFEAIEKARSEAEQNGDSDRLKRLRQLIVQCRQEAQLVSRSKIISQSERVVASEIAHWLAIWLEQPQLFPDWLSLRQRSAEYQRKFG